MKWFTQGRRFPKLIGKTADGHRLWGGPYTFTQAGVAVVMVLVIWVSARFWAKGDILTNALIAAMLLAGTVFAAGKIPLGIRNPLAMAAGLWRAYTTKGWKLAGTTPPVMRPHLARSRASIHTPTATAPDAEPAPPAAQVQQPSTRVLPAPSGVQKLLAGAKP